MFYLFSYTSVGGQNNISEQVECGSRYENLAVFYRTLKRFAKKCNEYYLSNILGGNMLIFYF